MIRPLPSFHIEVTEQLSLTGKAYLHRINANTSRICNLIKPSLTSIDQVLVEKASGEPIGTTNPKSFYSRIAVQLSGIDEHDLSDHFADLRICYTATRSQKNYDFHFKREVY